MEWQVLYPVDKEPSFENISNHITNPLWASFTSFIEQGYGSKPRIEYSRCGAAPGWNVKYRARGKALCTVYPHDGFFTCMVSIGAKEKAEAEILMQTCDYAVRNLYEQSAELSMGRWLMIDVVSEAILKDVLALILLRVAPKGDAR